VLDVETRSVINLQHSGVTRYARHASTQLICLAWGWADEDRPPASWLPGEAPPAALLAHIASGGTIAAWNIGFDLAIWNALLAPLGWPRLEIAQAHDIAAQAAAAGLPRGLEKCAEAMGLALNKDRAGALALRSLMRPAKWARGVPVWREADAERLLAVIEYCRRDVAVERAAHRGLPKLQEYDRPVWQADMRINARGMRVDPGFIRHAGPFYVRALQAAHEEAARITGGAVKKISNTNATATWLEAQGCPMAAVISLASDNNDADADADGETPAKASRKGALTKPAVRTLLERPDLPACARALLELRRDALRTSTAKIIALAAACEPSDGRIHDTLVYHAASTGRAGGTLLQPQNLPRASFDDAKWDRALAGMEEVNAGRLGLDGFAEQFGAPMIALTAMIRGSIIAAPGHELVGADFKNIELRVNAWLAGEQSLLDELAAGVDVYTSMAAEIYGIPRQEVDPHTQRHVGKAAALGCGFGLGWAKFIEFTTALTGIILPEQMARQSVKAFREKYRRIPLLWRELEDAALGAVHAPGTKKIAAGGRLGFYCDKVRHWLLLRLPSGRVLRYSRPSIEVEDGPYGLREVLRFWGVNQMTRKWGLERSWGGVLCENAVQAVARDICMEAVQRVEARGWPVVLHVHDEVIAEVPIGCVSAETFGAVMTERVGWAEGLPTLTDTWRGERYG
jgi:DNA polymerase